MLDTLPLGNTLSVFVFNWTTLTPSLNHLFLWTKEVQPLLIQWLPDCLALKDKLAT